MKEKIVMINEIVTNDCINIHNSHTSFCRMDRQVFPNINKVEQELKDLRKQLRCSNVSLGMTGTVKLLRERKDEYTEMVNEYNESFDKLVMSWREKMNDGIYVGYRDDSYINDVINPLSYKLQKMNYRSTMLSMVRDIDRTVKEVKSDLNNGVNFIKVSI